jgi:hypothetical protein
LLSVCVRSLKEEREGNKQSKAIGNVRTSVVIIDHIISQFIRIPVRSDWNTKFLRKRERETKKVATVAPRLIAKKETGNR